jgi:hypothetical protein
MWVRILTLRDMGIEANTSGFVAILGAVGNVCWQRVKGVNRKCWQGSTYERP